MHGRVHHFIYVVIALIVVVDRFFQHFGKIKPCPQVAGDESEDQEIKHEADRDRGAGRSLVEARGKKSTDSPEKIRDLVDLRQSDPNDDLRQPVADLHKVVVLEHCASGWRYGSGVDDPRNSEQKSHQRTCTETCAADKQCDSEGDKIIEYIVLLVEKRSAAHADQSHEQDSRKSQYYEGPPDPVIFFAVF